MTDDPVYDRIGSDYNRTRRPDRRVAAAISRTLGDARSVINVGAGTGAYEPTDRQVTAVEPSAVMLAQRPAGAAPAVHASAEDLPFPDGAFDAAIAILSDHHWTDRDRGLRELRRVASSRVVLLNADPAKAEAFWLTRDYLPGFLDLIPAPMLVPGAWRASFEAQLGPITIQPVPIPHGCTDGFYPAYWRRPHAYLDPAIRHGTSVFARLDPDATDHGLAALDTDLRQGAWHERNADLLKLDAADLGLSLIIA